MLVNVCLNYVLIFGMFGFPEMGIKGAACGVIIGNFTGLMVIVAAYLRTSNRIEYGIGKSIRFDVTEFWRLIRFGLPAGMEIFLNLLAFNAFVQLFHSYGSSVAAAITVTFTWDMVAFFPMTGIHIATISMVGRYMGGGDIASARRATFSSLKLAYFYALIIGSCFLFIPGILVGVFAQPSSQPDYTDVVPLAISMLRIACIYTLADATSLVFCGALRGAGDTVWCMWISVTLHWIMAITVYIMIHYLHCAPLTVCVTFSLMVVCLGVAYFLRFNSSKWQKIRVLG
jgi:MATE family multidrug resistance protein